MMNNVEENSWTGSEWRAETDEGLLSTQADKRFICGIRLDLVKVALGIGMTESLLLARGPVRRQ